MLSNTYWLVMKAAYSFQHKKKNIRSNCEIFFIFFSNMRSSDNSDGIYFWWINQICWLFGGSGSLILWPFFFCIDSFTYIMSSKRNFVRKLLLKVFERFYFQFQRKKNIFKFPIFCVSCFRSVRHGVHGDHVVLIGIIKRRYVFTSLSMSNSNTEKLRKLQLQWKVLLQGVTFNIF